MTPHQELSKLRKEEISPQLSKTHCKKYVDWHRQATPRTGGVSACARMRRRRPKAENINWQKLEALAFGQAGQPKSKKVEFKAGTKLLIEY